MTTPERANPYRPPAAPVANTDDIDPPKTAPPRLVSIAAICFALSQLVGLANVSMLGRHATSGPLVSFAIAMTLALSLFAWLTYKTWQGRNWSRIVILIFFVLVIPRALLGLPALFQLAPLAASIVLLQSVLYLVAIAILFLTTARHWFSKRRESR